ncbi:septal ring lytic transglycosylase RlpA family protein [Salisaeta longa]|uniref:septal ring lytic transglycosylase RlpA family protein n=1 Tax=Salisaeta longa TaxID=503170 RepID=UPI0003B3A4BA|nr:septal ring lytic transglycosylase RlpA family protein [Salisaeta longa]
MKLLRTGWMIAATCLLVACGGPRAAVAPAPEVLPQEGQASYISDALAGNTTASGEPYRPSALTAAHRQLPFGTRVRVRRLDTGASVVVRINDRGPFVDGRIIDLSKAAARRIRMIRAGIVPVRVTLVERARSYVTAPPRATPAPVAPAAPADPSGGW